jgi:hypothetical protein
MDEYAAAKKSTIEARFPECRKAEPLLFFRICPDGGVVALSDEDFRLSESRQAGICQNCGKPMPDGRR